MRYNINQHPIEYTCTFQSAVYIAIIMIEIHQIHTSLCLKCSSSCRGAVRSYPGRNQEEKKIHFNLILAQSSLQAFSDTRSLIGRKIQVKSSSTKWNTRIHWIDQCFRYSRFEPTNNEIIKYYRQLQLF